MAKKKKAGGGTKNTEVVIKIKDFGPVGEQLKTTTDLAKDLAPAFVANLGAAGKQFVVTLNNKGSRPK